MAALTVGQLAYLHSELGTDIDEFDMQDRFDRLGSVQHVAMEVLRQRLADFIKDPAAVTTPQVSANTAANITALQKQLERVALELPNDETGDVPPLPVVTTAKLVSTHGRRGLGRLASERDRARFGG